MVHRMPETKCQGTAKMMEGKWHLAFARADPAVLGGRFFRGFNLSSAFNMVSSLSQEKPWGPLFLGQ